MTHSTTQDAYLLNQIRITAVAFLVILLSMQCILIFYQYPPFAIVISLIQVVLVLFVIRLCNRFYRLCWTRHIFSLTFISFVVLYSVVLYRHIQIHYLLLLAIPASSLFYHRNEQRQMLIFTGILTLTYIGLSRVHLYLSDSGLNAKLWVDVSLGLSTLFTVVVLGKQSGIRHSLLRKKWLSAKQAFEATLPIEPKLSDVPFCPGEYVVVNHVYVLFADLKGYKKLNETLSDEGIVKFLHQVYVTFDRLARDYGVTRLKTNGDEYMAVLGLNHQPNQLQHVLSMARFSFAILDAFETFIRSQNLSCAIRIGISRGTVMAGVVGQQQSQLDIWGKTVNTAAFLESVAPSNGILVCETIHQQLSNTEITSFKTERFITDSCYATAYRLTALDARPLRHA